jgi:hypothetical protein
MVPGATHDNFPGLMCELTNSSESEKSQPPQKLRVARIDQDGVFLMSEPGGIFRLRRDQEAEMMFSYREKRILCRGQAVSVLDPDEAVAAGFQFGGMSADAEKELGDFVETLRGEGHV